ncbi:MAG: glycosyltransferase family 39 protein [Ardenticatenales bacterium]
MGGGVKGVADGGLAGTPFPPALSSSAMPHPPPTSSAQRRRRWLVLALVVTYALFCATHLGGAYWDSDEGLNLMKGRLFGLGHPLYTRIWSDQPPGYTVLLAAAFSVFGPSVAAARAVTAAFGLAAAFAASSVARSLGGGWWAGLAAAVVLAVAPNFFWASRAAMIGLPALALATAAMACALRFGATGRRRDLALAGLLLGASAWLKLIGAYLIVPIALAVWLRRRGERHAYDPAMGCWDDVIRDLAVLALTTAAPLALMLAAFDARALLAQVVGTVVGARGAAPLDVAWNAGKLADWLIARDLGRPDWTFADHAALIAPALAGLVVGVRRKRDAGVVVAAWLALTVIALLLQNPLWPKHHFLALLVVLAPLAGVGIEWAVGAIRDALRARGGESTFAARSGAIVAALAGAFIVAATLIPLPTALAADRARLLAVPFKESGKLPSRSDSWRTLDDAIAFLRDHTAAGDWVVTDQAYAAFRADRPIPPELAVVSSKRITTGGLTADDVIRITDEAHRAAVLFWDGDRLTDAFPAFVQWVGWNYDKVDGAPAGWTLWLRKGHG